MFSNVSSSKVNSFTRMSQSITFVNWHNMRNSITWIQNNTGGLSSRKSSINLIFTKRERPELRQRRLALETFQKIFQAFSFCALLGSYWLQSEELGIRLGRLWGVKKHVSREAPYHPSNRQHRVKLGIWVCRGPFFQRLNHRPCSVKIGC